MCCTCVVCLHACTKFSVHSTTEGRVATATEVTEGEENEEEDDEDDEEQEEDEDDEEQEEEDDCNNDKDQEEEDDEEDQEEQLDEGDCHQEQQEQDDLPLILPLKRSLFSVERERLLSLDPGSARELRKRIRR